MESGRADYETEPTNPRVDELSPSHVVASEAFAHLDYILYELLWRWAKRRHPKKGHWWISTKYWHRRGNQNWVFSTETKELIRVDHTPIVRHTKVR
ncbi:MAG: group II intron maturase-specific domain-containing protein [Blautia faecis]